MTIQLHRNPPIIWAHRGGRSLAAENTLLAVRRAHLAGTDGWETDVVLTRDGVPVLLHDLNLLRTTNAMCHDSFTRNPPLLPWRFSLAEIKQLNAGTFPQRQCGNTVGKEMAALGAVGPASPDMAVPTLAEGLRLSAELGLYVNIEIKNLTAAKPEISAETIVTKVHEVIAEEAMSERVIVSSFNHDYLVESKKLSPHILTGALTPHRFSGDPVSMVRAIGADAWHPGFRKLSRKAVAAAREAGIAVNPYTVNETDDMKRFAEWGVSGIVTDRPQDMRTLFA